MTLALGNLGLFGSKATASMGESRMLVNEMMTGEWTVDTMSKADIAKYLNAFEVQAAMEGLNPDQMLAYSELLRCC